MRRGTTPPITFTLPFEVSILSDLRLTLSQNNKTIIEKKLPDCTFQERVGTVKLTQEETLLLKANSMIELQFKFLFTSGDVVPSKIYKFYCEKILCEEVLKL